MTHYKIHRTLNI